MRTDSALDRAIAACRSTLDRPPAGLVTDFDGTLSPIVDNPADVALAPGGREALDALSERVAVVAIVTGRAPMDARRFIGTDRVLIVGNHGVEWLAPGETRVAPDPRSAELRPALERMVASVPPGEGILVEDKGLSATVHYRNAPDPGAARAQVLDALREAADPAIGMRHGRMSVELRALDLGDKGTAVRAIVDRYALRGLVVLGDDVTDLDMFRAARELQAARGIRASIVAVAGGAEVPPEVGAAADVVLPDPAAAVALVAALGRRSTNSA
jgi:trehalose 6-phosphate phosphatase